MATNRVGVGLFNREIRKRNLKILIGTGAQEKKRGESVGCCHFSVIKKIKNEDCPHVIALGYFPF